ncbi:hypothetical protein BDN70DRAFT_867348 [Pholiota conissans]|uniref:Endopeptidase S2P n=1 Tax=Pholiota conissans TaxID=109636 RepID=A0A9P5YRM5_9AGAR|nr:hypothetical protein BDN70DRAFT_867348 [Pholiota conissans]
MSIWAAFSFLAAVWCIIHVLYFLSHHQETSLLPTQSHLSVSSTRRPLFGGKLQHLKVTLNGLQLQVSTTRWNTTHDKLNSLLSRRTHKTLATAVQGFYTLGTLVAGVGMLVAVFTLFFICVTNGWTLARKVAISHRPHADAIPFGDVHLLTKRSASFAEGEGLAPASVDAGASSFPTITPIVPGVTVPLSHLPVIIAAVFIAQVVHEVGHALAAALEFLPMTACGASFTVCIPAAFVSFPTSAMKTLPPKARSRIIAAGPYHNLVFWAFLSLAAWSGVAHLASFVSGYRDISSIGKVVVDVNPESPLSLHLQPGSIITQLDDTSLGSTSQSIDVWTTYLQGTVKESLLGWCVAKSVLGSGDFLQYLAAANGMLSAKSYECCNNEASKRPSAFSCFGSKDSLERGCIDPVPILTSRHGDNRCQSSDKCPPESSCVFPSKGVQLLRLTVRSSISNVQDQTTILWSGPPIEIWEEVQVSTWVPRIWVLPLWIPPLAATFWEYLTMATLSLYFFNLLPLPHLDGTQLLHSFLDWGLNADQGASSYNFGALEGGESDQQEPRTRRRWKERILRYCPYTMTCIAIGSILFSILNALY